MRREILMVLVAVAVATVLGGCDGITGPDRTGTIDLSSERLGSDPNYYVLGYAYEFGEYYRYRYQGEPEPDIINDGYLVIEEGEVAYLPGFNTPGQMNGFALVGEHESLETAREYYDDYLSVDRDLQFETVSDTVELFQVWVQRTVLGNYVKLLVRDIQMLEGESGTMYNVVKMDYTYQPDGSNTFLD